MSRVLLVGGGGFLGRPLGRALVEAGHSVVAASRHVRALPPGIRGVALDISGTEDLNRLDEPFDLIVHAATVRPRFEEGWAGLDAALRTNVLGTSHVLSFAERRGVPRLVYCSTLSIYQLPQPLPIAEDGRIFPVAAPDSYYAISKLAGELLCARAHEEGRVRCLALRLGRIYGPGEPAGTLLSQWIARARAGQEIVVHGSGERSLDFIFIDDAVQAALRAVEVEWAGGALNVSRGTEVTWRDLAEAVAEVFAPDARPAIRYLLEGDRTRCVLDVRKARTVLGFSARFALGEGLQAWRAREEQRVTR